MFYSSLLSNYIEVKTTPVNLRFYSMFIWNCIKTQDWSFEKTPQNEMSKVGGYGDRWRTEINLWSKLVIFFAKVVLDKFFHLLKAVIVTFM